MWIECKERRWARIFIFFYKIRWKIYFPWWIFWQSDLLRLLSNDIENIIQSYSAQELWHDSAWATLWKPPTELEKKWMFQRKKALLHGVLTPWVVPCNNSAVKYSAATGSPLTHNNSHLSNSVSVSHRKWTQNLDSCSFPNTPDRTLANSSVYPRYVLWELFTTNEQQTSTSLLICPGVCMWSFVNNLGKISTSSFLK